MRATGVDRRSPSSRWHCRSSDLILLGLFDVGPRGVRLQRLDQCSSRGRAPRDRQPGQGLVRQRAQAMAFGIELSSDAAATTTFWQPGRWQRRRDPERRMRRRQPIAVGCIAVVSPRPTWRAITPLLGNIVGPITFKARSELPIEFVALKCPTIPDLRDVGPVSEAAVNNQEGAASMSPAGRRAHDPARPERGQIIVLFALPSSRSSRWSRWSSRAATCSHSSGSLRTAPTRPPTPARSSWPRSWPGRRAPTCDVYTAIDNGRDRECDGRLHRRVHRRLRRPDRPDRDECSPRPSRRTHEASSSQETALPAPASRELIGITELTASASATVVAGALSGDCVADEDGCTLLPVTFPVQVFQCDWQGDLIPGGLWIGAPPPGADPADPYFPIVDAGDLPTSIRPEREPGHHVDPAAAARVPAARRVHSAA